MWNKFSLFVACGCLLMPAAGHGEIEIQGRVLSGVGAPLSEVEVALSEIPSSSQLGPLVAAGQTHPPPTAITRTDANGRFVVAAPRSGMWTVIVAIDGFLPVEHLLQPLLEPADLGTLVLEQATDRRLRILDAEGRPVVGALARLTEELRWSRFTQTSGGWWPALSLGVSDEQGWLTLPMGRGENFEAIAWAPGFLETFTGRRGARQQLRLNRGQPRPIEIRGPDRRPLADAQILLGSGQWPVASSDADGRVTIAAPAREATALRVVSAAGNAGFHLTPAEAEAGPEVLTLPPGRSLTGRIIDARGNAPIAGAWIWPRQDPTGFVRSGAHGEFLLPLGAADADQIVAAAPGFLPTTEAMTADSGVVQPPIIALEPAARLDGVVVDVEGHTLLGVRIEARLSTDRSPVRPPTPDGTATSDARGRFRLPGLESKRHYELIARAEGFAPARVEVATFESSGERVRIVLDRGRKAFGAVADAGGEPVVGAEVALTSTASTDLSKTTHSDRQGVFEWVRLPAGRYDLSIAARGFAPAVVRGLELSADGETDLGTVFLDPGTRLEGRVITRGGTPLAGVAVHALVQAAAPGLAEPAQQLQTDAEGRFAAVDLRPGERVTLQLWKEGYQNRMVSGLLAPTAEPIEITLSPAARVSGRVIDGDRQPIARARVGLIRDGSGPILGDRAGGHGAGGPSSLSDANGEFTIDAVAPGRYSLAAFAEGFQPTRTGELEVDAGHDLVGQVLKLEAGAILEGRVLAPEGRPVLGARVAVVGSGGSSRPAITDGDGGYRITGLVLGGTSIEASHPDHQRVIRELQVRPGVNDLDLKFESGVEIAGWVLTDAGDPVSFARLSLAPGGSVTTTEATGEFTFPSVGDGRHRIRIDRPGHPSVALGDEVEVAGVPIYGLELLLEVSGAIIGNLRGLSFDETARVQVSALSSGRSAIRGLVDYEGGYRIDRLAPGEWTVIAEIPGDPRTSRGRITVEPGSPEVLLDLDFASGHTLSGRVLNAGQPVADAIVLLSGVQGAAGAGKTDTAGGFLLTGIEAGGYLLTISHLDRGLDHSREVDLDSDHDLIIDLTTARRATEPESGRQTER